MTDTTTTPEWLAAAEEDHELRRMEKEGNGILLAQANAGRVNRRLDELGIVPEEPAYVDQYGRLQAARVLLADYEAETNEVRATWDDRNNMVALHTADYEDDHPQFGPVGLLHTAADIVEARKMAPRFPEPATNFRALAQSSMGRLRADNTGPDAHAIAEAINGLTAAVLHLAATNQRP